MERRGEKNQDFQQAHAKLIELHQEDVTAGDIGPFKKTENRARLSRSDETIWAGELQHPYGEHRRGPNALRL